MLPQQVPGHESRARCSEVSSIPPSERTLTLDFECLHTMPTALREVRIYYDELTDCLLVGKRLDLSEVEDSADVLEPQIMRSINHVNVVPVHNAARVAGYPQPMQVVEIVMPYYERGSITDALLRGERFAPTTAMAITQAALRGLSEMHERHNVLHRDIKAPNLLLTEDSTLVKVADLGLAGRMDAHGSTPMVNAPMLYSPPELIAEGRLTRASDLYSLGLVVYELLSGPFPYASYSRTDVLDRLMDGKAPLLEKDKVLPPWAPKRLRRVLKKATSVHPVLRFQTARQMADALAKVVLVDWVQTDDLRWEAPFLHKAGKRVAVEGQKRRDGSIRLTAKTHTRAWRRLMDAVDVVSMEDPRAVDVFAQATSTAAAR